MKTLIKISVAVIGLIMLVFGLKLAITGESIQNSSDVQEINMQVDYSGYSPNSFVLKKGVPVIWNIEVTQLSGCNRELVLEDYNIDKQLSKGLNIIEFTPTKTGTLTFTCGMGMLRGMFIVTETGTASQSEIKAATPKSGGSCGCGRAK